MEFIQASIGRTYRTKLSELIQTGKEMKNYLEKYSLS